MHTKSNNNNYEYNTTWTFFFFIIKFEIFRTRHALDKNDFVWIFIQT